MKTVTVKDKTFVLSLAAETIQKRIVQLAVQIKKDMNGETPMLVCVLKGSFMFAADLFRNIEGDAEITFIRVSSYSGTASTGEVKSVVGITENLEGRSVIIVEDIVDTGDTAVYLIDELKKHGPARIAFASLLLKPKALRHPVKIDYIGFEVPNDFLVGFGLDYDGLGRNLNDIYKLA